MKGQNKWGYQPYTPLHQYEKRMLPYICRLAPGKTFVELEWMDKGSQGKHYVYWKPWGSEEEYQRKELDGKYCLLKDLKEECDYEIFVAREKTEERSAARLVRTGEAVGVVVNYLHPMDEALSYSGQYLCSPSLVKLPSGVLLASMDVFGHKAPQNLTLIYRSEDNGASWSYVTDLFPCYWGKLFCHKGALYMLATTTEYGNLVIGKSMDEGRTWSEPVILLPGAGQWSDHGVHKAPMPVISLDGRLYTAIDYGAWSKGGHGSGLLSIDEEADLLVPENWSCTGFLPYDASWPGAAKGKSGGGLEGNAVAGPDGEIYNVLRYQMAGCDPSYAKALVLKGNKREVEEALQFAWFADFNGGSNSKFDLLYDKETNAYWAVVNEVVQEKLCAARNVLSLAVSQDLKKFRIVHRILDFSQENPDLVGFQYVSFLIDGENLLLLSRSAFNQAHNMHDANYITFHRIENFRKYLM